MHEAQPPGIPLCKRALNSVFSGETWAGWRGANLRASGGIFMFVNLGDTLNGLDFGWTTCGESGKLKASWKHLWSYHRFISNVHHQAILVNLECCSCRNIVITPTGRLLLFMLVRLSARFNLGLSDVILSRGFITIVMRDEDPLRMSRFGWISF